VNVLKNKIVMLLIMLGITSAMWIGLTSAQEDIRLYAYTDKPYYGYGDEGTLYVTVQNKGSAVDLNYIKVEFPWEDGQLWNYTYLNIGEALGGGKNQTYKITFKIPSESRSNWKNNDATVVLDHSGTESPATTKVKINLAMPVNDEIILPIYYLLGVLTTAVIIVIVELYFVWRRLGKLTAPSAPS